MKLRRLSQALSVGSVLAAILAGSASGAPRLPPPTFGRSVDIGLVSGTVIVRPLAGSSFRLGAQDRNIPVGSEIDTRRGEVDLRSALAPGEASATANATRPVQDAQFRGGLFEILQPRSQHGLTVLDLVTTSSMLRACALGSTANATPGHLSSRVLQTLRAHDSGGQFQTRGRYSAATVRGTTWDTTDRCDGTLTVVLSGTIDVYDFGLHKTISVHAGHRYLAKAPADRTYSNADNLALRIAARAAGGQSRRRKVPYCAEQQPSRPLGRVRS